ncbi:MAG: bifunctional histidinol-phosphatase/imidazoleglycerol-phosphate dehydratase HisB [Gammaproteobacteria bacterium]|nr:bifunctional histidinol-phosphatase/imidazoleglycerol-phosphate dehydratase HisB [Gammaproteobacteria bacterium]MDH5275903.1 bifunctional histidinol-phosphatase/imidazoleglycerol-phosphate dehydratase HisB [Gammaproteobacteria bacterium]
MATTRKIAFLDRDGTLILEPADEQVDRLDKIALVPGVIPALIRLRDAGYEFVMVTNQDGLGTASFPEAAFRQVQEFIVGLFASQGITFSEVFVCPHLPGDGCACRKPSPGLLGDFLSTISLDRDRSFVAGDRTTDLEFARNIGVQGFRVDPVDAGSWPGIAHLVVDQPRTATVERRTRETRISAVVDLDAEAPVSIRTGIGFFDHMLEQIAKHGGFSLTLSCDGDLQVDEHHTVEDVALALGEALRAALGDKRGIGRFGFLLPMDETEAQISLDLSGRAYLVFDGEFKRQEVGQLPTELVPHFFRSVADSLGANLHIAVRGENTHHMVEACFKGFGRTLRQAIARTGTSLPSTKGTL